MRRELRRVKLKNRPFEQWVWLGRRARQAVERRSASHRGPRTRSRSRSSSKEAEAIGQAAKTSEILAPLLVKDDQTEHSTVEPAEAVQQHKDKQDMNVKDQVGAEKENHEDELKEKQEREMLEALMSTLGTRYGYHLLEECLLAARRRQILIDV